MISRILQRVDNRYLTSRERGDIVAYLATVRARRAALEEVRQAAGRIVDEAVAELRGLYPQFTKHRPQGFDKSHRDMCLVTHMAANAMFLGETETVDEVFTCWFQTILKSVHLTPQIMTDAFALWMQSMQRNLSAETFDLLRPAAEHMVGILTQLPDPPKDEVGPRRITA